MIPKTFEALFDLVGLIVAMLQHKPAPWLQTMKGAAHNLLQVAHTIRPCRQGAAWLKADVTTLQMCILVFYIWGVAEDKIKGGFC